jgi:glutamate transport system permease protein
MSTQPVLFDTPGPKTRRNSMLWSVVALVAIGYVVYLGAKRLADNGQFDSELWAPLFDPSHENFNLVWQRIGEGFLANIEAAAIAMTLSLLIGTFLALTRVTAARGVRWFVVGFIELFRGIPVVIAIFFAFRVLPEFGIELDTIWFLVIGLTAYNSVVIAEIVRAGINAVPQGQSEAALAIGLTRRQSLNIVLLPQAIRIMLPALISQLVVILKDTALGFIVAYEELVRTSQRIGQTFDNPLQSLLVAAVIFIVVNMVLSWFATYLERRLSQRTRRPAELIEMPTDAVTGA